MRSLSSDSLKAKTYPILGSYEVHLRSYYLPFPVCSVPPTFQQKVQANHVQEHEDWFLCLTLGNVSRMKDKILFTTLYVLQV